jgi:hypothetical protein
MTEIGGYLIIIFGPNRFFNFVGLFQSQPPSISPLKSGRLLRSPSQWY